MICMQRCVKVDNKVRTDVTFPCGFMDVVSLEKTNQHFRLLYDTKVRFVVHQIHKDEAAYKLCRVQQAKFGDGGNPYVVTHDGRTIRFPDPDVKVHDTVMVIGEGTSAWISLPKGKGIKLSNTEDRKQR